MIAIGHYLYNIIYSEIYQKEDWQSWADKQILEYSDLDLWIYDLAVAATKEEVFTLLADRILAEREEITGIKVSTDIIQGYYYDRYDRKEISLYQLLEYSGLVADAGKDSEDCEYFYNMLNQMDARPSIVNEALFMKEIYDYFTKRKEYALQEREIIERIKFPEM